MRRFLSWLGRKLTQSLCTHDWQQQYDLRHCLRCGKVKYGWPKGSNLDA